MRTGRTGRPGGGAGCGGGGRVGGAGGGGVHQAHGARPLLTHRVTGGLSIENQFKAGNSLDGRLKSSHYLFLLLTDDSQTVCCGLI